MTEDLPIPIEPVRPICIGGWAFTTDVVEEEEDDADEDDEEEDDAAKDEDDVDNIDRQSFECAKVRNVDLRCKVKMVVERNSVGNEVKGKRITGKWH